MKVRIKTEGFKELDAALAEFSKATSRNILRRAAIASLEPIAASAKARVPVLSGDLRDSITTSAKLANRQAKLRYSAAMFAKQGVGSAVSAMRNELRASGRGSIEVFVGAGQLPHAHLQEFGSVNNPPQPYMRPAWDAGRDRVLGDMKTHIVEQIQKASARARRKAMKARR